MSVGIVFGWLPEYTKQADEPTVNKRKPAAQSSRVCGRTKPPILLEAYTLPRRGQVDNSFHVNVTVDGRRNIRRLDHPTLSPPPVVDTADRQILVAPHS